VSVTYNEGISYSSSIVKKPYEDNIDSWLSMISSLKFWSRNCCLCKNTFVWVTIKWDKIRCVYMYTLLEWYAKMSILNLCFLSYFRNRWGCIAIGWFCQPDSDRISYLNSNHIIHCQKLYPQQMIIHMTFCRRKWK
jgi:hypothetical protein